MTSDEELELYSQGFEEEEEIGRREKKKRNCVGSIRRQTTEEQEFWKWLKANQSDIDRVAWPYFDENGRGVCATVDFQENEEIFQVPRSVMMTVSQAWMDQALGPFLTHNSNATFASDALRTLGLFLALEDFKGAQSFWAPYLSTLPKEEDFADFVDQWSVEELDLLCEPLFAQLVQGKQAELRLTFSQLYDALSVWPDLSDFQSWLSFDRYRWAQLCVESRAYLDRFDTENSHPVLIPFADMLNHNPQQADATEFTSLGFHLLASRPIAKESAIFNSYGRKTNRELLLSYGFAIDNNPWDYVPVSFPWDTLPATPTSSPDVEKKRLALLFMYENDKQNVERLFLRVVPCRVFLWLCRVLHATSLEDLERLRASLDEPVSVPNELKAVQTYRQCLCNARPAKNLQDDEDEMNGQTRRNSVRRRLIRSFNTSQEAILDAHLCFCTTRIEQLQVV